MIGFRTRIRAAARALQRLMFSRAVRRELHVSRPALPVTLRCLEPRRVLSVNAAFAAGVLDIAIQNDGGNTNAGLFSDDGVHFFVDADGDQTYDDGSGDPLELRGLLSELTRINVVGDNGVGSFLWRDNFSTAMLSAMGPPTLAVGDVATVNLAAVANITGNVSLQATQSLQLDGTLSISGDLTAATNLATGSILTTATASLEVGGHTSLTGHTISLGTTATDHLALGSLTVTASGDVTIAEDGSPSDPDMRITGANTAQSLAVTSGGSIELASGATVNVEGHLAFTATGENHDVQIDGSLISLTGNVTLVAGDQIRVGSAAVLATADAGELSLTANGAGIELSDGSQLSTVDGDLRLTALDADGGHIQLSQLSTGGGPDASVHLMAAGNITDGTAAETANILAPTGTLWLTSLGGNIGAVGEDIDVDVQQLAFEAGAATAGLVHISDLAGGLRIHAASRAAGGATLTANSPLTIAADVTVNASSSFTAGNSAAAGDNLTIENAAVVTLDAAAPAQLELNAGDDIIFSGGGRVLTQGNTHTVFLNADLDHAGLGAADGDRGSITQDGTAIVEVSTSLLIARAGLQIDLDTQIDNLDARSLFLGSITIDEVDDMVVDWMETLTGSVDIRAGGDLDLVHVSTGDGSIDALANGSIAAINVDSSGTDSDSNDVRLTSSTADVVVSYARAGLLQGDVIIDAQRHILDGDTGTDGIDIEGNAITLVAHTGNIGVPGSDFFKDLPTALEVRTYHDPGDLLQPGDLTATALAGSIALDATVAGDMTITTSTLYLVSMGDLDVSSGATLNVTNLALIADADADDSGTLTLGNSLAVAGDLRLEGADIVSVGPGAPVLDLAATRLSFQSGGAAEIEAAVLVLDAAAGGPLTIRTSLATIDLVDLNCDNIALQTTDVNASIALQSRGTITVVDDVWAGNDGLFTSTGGIEFSFAPGTVGDILIHDSLLTDGGNIVLSAPGAIELQLPAVAHPLDQTGVDNLAVISTIDGNISLLADTDGNGGGILLADGSQVIAGRAAVAYDPGMDGLPPLGAPTLGNSVKVAGQAQVELRATDSITLGSVQSANATAQAILISSSAGAILDGGATHTDLITNQPQAVVTLQARSGIGGLDALETSVARIDLSNTGPSGNVAVQQVASGGALQVIRAVNQANAGNVYLTVDAGSLHIAGSGVTALDGHITLQASNDVHIASIVQTGGMGDVFVWAGNDTPDAVLPNVDGITVDAQVVTEAGNILMQSQADIRVAAPLTSDTGAIGLTAAGNIGLASSLTAGGDVLVDAGSSLLMSSTASIAGDDIVLTAGSGQTLAEVTGNRVALRAGNNILDGNGVDLNIRATELHILAGGSIGAADTGNGQADQNANALDVDIDRLAAHSATGIYIHQPIGGGDLLVTTLLDLSVAVSADRLAADASSVSVTDQQTVAGQSGLATDAGPIKIHVASGDLQLASGGITAGGSHDVLLWASQDLLVGTAVSSAGGNITLRAGDDLAVNAAVATTADGSLTLSAANANLSDTLAPAVDGITVNASLTTEGGSLLLDSAADISIAASVTSSSAIVSGKPVVGSIGVVAAGDVLQSANVTTTGNVLIDAGGNYGMLAGSQLVAAGNALVRSGQSMTLTQVEAAQAALVAGQDILRLAGSGTNITATSLSLRAAGNIGSPDAANGTPALNSRAITVAVDTLAALAGNSLYVEQVAAGGDLQIDTVASLQVSIATTEARFNSTATPRVTDVQADALQDLTAEQGALKLVVRDGSLIINDGAVPNGIGASAAGGGDILLSASVDLELNAAVGSDSGHISLLAGDDLRVNANVTTAGAGTLYLRGQNGNAADELPGGVDGVTVAGVLTADGNIVVDSQAAIRTQASITSSAGDVALVATTSIEASGSVATPNGDVYATAGSTFTNSGNVVAGGDVLVVSQGTQTIGLIEANSIGLVAVNGDVLDGNGLDVTNIRANQASIVAGGIIGGPDPLAAAGVNANALDLELATLAASSRDGIYVQQLAAGGDLRIDLVSGQLPPQVSVQQVHFNSTRDAVTIVEPLLPQPLADLQTINGPIKVAVRGGGLLLNDGDADTLAVVAGGSGDVLLQATGAITTNAAVTSGSGNLSVWANGGVDLNAALSTTGTGSIYIRGNTIDVDAPLHTATGSILLQANTNLQTTASITSDEGSVGLQATGGNVVQGSSVSAGGDVLVTAGGDYIQNNSATLATATAQVIVDGSIRLDSITATHIALAAGQDILDNSPSETANLLSNTLALVAGGIIGGADLGNTPDANGNAIDLDVDQMAARSRDGMYLQQLSSGGNLLIDHVEGSASVTVTQVNFNSTQTSVAVGDPDGTDLRPLEDLVSTAGPVKLVVRDGNLTVQDGQLADGIGVSAGNVNDVLLAASGQITLAADLSSEGGHVNLRAGSDLVSQADVVTSGDGAIYLTAGNDQQLQGGISTQSGDIFAQSGRDVLLSGDITSQSGNVGLAAGRDVLHSGSVSTSGSGLVVAARHALMGTGSIVAGPNLLIQTGSDPLIGNQQIGQLEATHVSLDAYGQIFDGNAAALNVTANQLRVTSHSLGSQADPLETRVGTLAVETDNGIYVQQLAGPPGLTIGHVAAVSVQVDVQQVNFNSSLSDVAQAETHTALDDLTTQRPELGSQVAIAVRVDSGNLIVTDGLDSDDRGVLVDETGSIILQTQNIGSIAIQTGIETVGAAAEGQVTLSAADNISELADLPGGSSSSALIVGDHLLIEAGGYAHLHHTQVNSLQASVGANGLLNDDWQKTNDLANEKGDDFLGQLGSERQAFAEAAEVIVEIDRTAASPLESAVREQYAQIVEQFRFADTYAMNYALYLVNQQTLSVQSVIAGNPLLADSDMPTVYIETGEGANLTIQGSIATYSQTATEGGIVLVAGAELQLQGSLTTSAQVTDTLTRIQRVEDIGSLPTTDALGQAAIAYLNARVFDGGEGVPTVAGLLASTQFVIRNQELGLSTFTEDYRTDVFQRVVAQYGFAGESGFVTFVGYADGEIQQFDVQGESGVRTTKTDNTNSDDQSALLAALRGTNQATAFSRATAFDSEFLNANQTLPTAAVIRRAADFFLFENAAADSVEAVRDLTVESFQVRNVFSLGAPGASLLPADVEPIEPPVFGLAIVPEVLTTPTQFVRNDIEFTTIAERTVEVAIFRVYYEDENLNGQAEESELPSEEEILSAEVAEVEAERNSSDEVPKGRRLKLESIKPAAGGSPTAEDIEALKNEYLNDPERPSGAYSIIEKGLDDKEVVLDIFSVRDRVAPTEERLQPLVRPPTAEELQQLREESESQQASPPAAATGEPTQPPTDATDTTDDAADDAPAGSGPAADAVGDIRPTSSRFAHAGLVAGAVWAVRVRAQQTNSGSTQASPWSSPVAEDAPQTPVDFSRLARRRRRWRQ